MAVPSSILSPAAVACQKTTALATGTSSAAIVLGNRVIFAVNATTDITIKFGVSGVAAAAATDFRVPSGATMTFDTGVQFDRVRVYNLDSSNTSDIYIQQLSKF